MAKSSVFQATGSDPTALQSYTDDLSNFAADAETSKDAAATSATAAATSATAAAASATAAATSETNAASSATGAASSETNASTSETNAATSASNASTSASSASASATSAASSASSASTSATNAATSETNAATSETNAAASSTSASTSASNAATSASNASTSETNAASSATSASTSASTATTQASNAATSASNAATSETNAATSETNAATSASNAASSATSAASSASSAASSASSAASAQSAAESARDSALAAYDSFDDRYLGAKSSDPTVDNDGNALVAGALYFDSTAGAMKLYNGSSWVAAYISGTGYAALSGATFTGNVTVPNLITSGNVDGRDVSVDGAKLDGIESGATADQTASEILTAIKTVDGAASGLDADLLDGQQGSHYLDYTNFTNTPTIPSNNNQLTNGAGYITGNQTITLSGDVSGSGSTSIAVTIADDSHNHIISNVDGLQTALDAKLPLSGGTMSGAITFAAGQTFDGRDVSADGSKLDGIEAGATADQTASEILTAIKTVDGASSGLDADLLDGQHGSYYYPASNPNGYTTNVGDITGVTAGNGLTGGGTSGTVTLNVGAGTGVTVAADTVSIGQDVATTASPSFGGLNINGNINAVDNIYLATKIYHEGDTDTYIDFPAANEARVVTGGSENIRFKTNYIQCYENVAGSVETASKTGSVTPDMQNYNSFVWTLTGNITLANPSNEVLGTSGVFVFIHSGAGRTVSLGTQYRTVGGAGLTLSSAAGAIDVVPYFVRATGIINLGAPQLAFS